ncbi:glycosyltransferase [Arundinibacter roseus]|uniref:Glycosyltransferase family 4 protein n=1 Tax=Arundinibacter roseus TaxID=2070510 RepID=A0A4V2X9E5_9BACT|nr:glycosyltransferase [Arundinibacter roseus]TDB63375.1 glycosyltransferase family 4 protein [Arundinibacter roseus]
MKVAIIHDWLTELGGAELVLKSILELFPSASLFTLTYSDKVINELQIDKSRLHVSFIHKLPFAQKHYRNYLPFFSSAIESFDLSSFDLILSSSYCVAKGVLTNGKQRHICYCHSPVRYAWDLYFQYLKEQRLTSGLKGFVAKYFLRKLRTWDVIASNRVDYFISNSDFIGRRIQRVYRRDSFTIYPPVDLNRFQVVTEKEEFYFTCSRLVPYKRIDIIVSAFSRMPDKKLIIIGDGPDYKKLTTKNFDNIDFLGFQPFPVLYDFMSRAKAFVFAAEEDFGIVPVEAQACGTPVIAFSQGGALESIKDGVSGLFFDVQSSDSIIDAVNRFEDLVQTFDPIEIRKNALKFSKENFQSSFFEFVESHL